MALKRIGRIYKNFEEKWMLNRICPSSHMNKNEWRMYDFRRACRQEMREGQKKC